MAIWMFYIFSIILIYSSANILAVNQCVKDADCLMKNSICVNKSCSCSPDYVYNSERTECLKVAHGYGAKCTDSVQCSASLQAGGTCNNGTCECVNGYHYFKGQCWKTAGLGESCEQNSNCYVSYDFEASICNAQKVCECSSDYYQREYSSCRRISKKPGEPCGITLDCQFQNAVCTKNRTCQIQSDDVNTAEIQENEVQYDIIDLCRKKRRIFDIFTNFNSVKLGQIGGKCTTDKDCPNNAQCFMQSVCYCKQGYYTKDNATCHPELGESCKTDADCLGKNTMCRGGKYCTCQDGFVTSYDSRYCDKMSRDINWSCLRDEQCGFFGPGGKCISKKCHCSNSTHWVQDKLYCWISRKVGENCVQLEDCGGQNSSMTCTESKCSCVAGTHASVSGESCHKDSKEIGQPCFENIDCMYNHASCDVKSNKCTCEKGYMENKEVCSPGINAPCKSNEDCFVPTSACVNNTCICNSSSIPSKNLDQCLPLADTINVQCSESEQCSKVDGICPNGLCECRNNSVYDPDSHLCYITRDIGQRCSGLRNCTVAHAVCKNHFCVCKSGYRARGNRCVNGGNLELPSTLLLLLSMILVFSKMA
uniref:Secreted EB-containing protein n=1 Tax=Pristhesancus plagipennis TaxID=1955184 RepID=A0A2K8JML2_PRIPG|nr:secreted EB-containing protein [Pristhesancus plagipennis]